MEKRTCKFCGTNNYSADSNGETWKCLKCGKTVTKKEKKEVI